MFRSVLQVPSWFLINMLPDAPGKLATLFHFEVDQKGVKAALTRNRSLAHSTRRLQVQFGQAHQNDRLCIPQCNQDFMLLLLLPPAGSGMTFS